MSNSNSPIYATVFVKDKYNVLMRKYLYDEI